MVFLKFEQSSLKKYSIKLKYSMPGSLVPLTIFLNIIFNINPSNSQVLQKKVKVIYVTRNPRDAVVCFFPSTCAYYNSLKTKILCLGVLL